MNGLREEWQETVSILQLNVNLRESRSLVEKYEGQFTPTVVILDKNGQEVWRTTGSIDPAEARRQLTEVPPIN